MRRTAIRGVLVGYGALVVAPLGPLLVRSQWAVGSTLAPETALLAVGSFAGAVAALAVTARIDVIAWLGHRSLLLVGLLLPAVWLVPLVEVARDVPSALFNPYAIGLAAVFLWLVAAAVAEQTRADERLAATTTVVSFTARPPASTRRSLRVAIVVIGLVSLVVIAASFVVGEGPPTSMLWILPTMVPVYVAVVSSGDGREVAITADGLRVERTLHDWDTVDDYELTEEELVFRRTGWWRGRLAFDASDLGNVSDVRTALDRYLERPPGGASRSSLGR